MDLCSFPDETVSFLHQANGLFQIKVCSFDKNQNSKKGRGKL